MRTIDFKLFHETWEEQSKAGRYNPANVAHLSFKRKVLRFTLACGDSDSVYAYRESHYVYFLSLNTSLGYVGLEAFDLDNPDYSPDSVFLQNDEEIESSLGKQGLDLLPHNIIRRLMEHIAV